MYMSGEIDMLSFQEKKVVLGVHIAYSPPLSISGVGWHGIQYTIQWTLSNLPHLVETFH